MICHVPSVSAMCAPPFALALSLADSVLAARRGTMWDSRMVISRLFLTPRVLIDTHIVENAQQGRKLPIYRSFSISPLD